MNKIIVTTILIATIFLNVACTNYDTESQIATLDSEPTSGGAVTIEGKKSETNRISTFPIEIKSKDKKEIIDVEIKEDSTQQEKVELIINTISEEAFNGLPMNATIYGNDMAKIVLKEPADSKNNRLSWKKDYLNEQNKENTINTIVKNVLQEQYKGTWIKTVQLYYGDELITLD